METQIIYGSQYGAAKRYAHRMAERTGIPMIPYDKAEDLTGCSTIIYIGGLYAGGVLGLARTMRNPNFKPKRWFLITVGVSDPQDEETRRAIREQLQKQICAEPWTMRHSNHPIGFSCRSYITEPRNRTQKHFLLRIERFWKHIKRRWILLT